MSFQAECCVKTYQKCCVVSLRWKHSQKDTGVYAHINQVLNIQQKQFAHDGSRLYTDDHQPFPKYNKSAADDFENIKVNIMETICKWKCEYWT